jgi:hypothetical protein
MPLPSSHRHTTPVGPSPIFTHPDLPISRDSHILNIPGDSHYAPSPSHLSANSATSSGLEKPLLRHSSADRSGSVNNTLGRMSTLRSAGSAAISQRSAIPLDGDNDLFLPPSQQHQAGAGSDGSNAGGAGNGGSRHFWQNPTRTMQTVLSPRLAMGGEGPLQR